MTLLSMCPCVLLQMRVLLSSACSQPRRLTLPTLQLGPWEGLQVVSRERHQQITALEERLEPLFSGALLPGTALLGCSCWQRPLPCRPEVAAPSHCAQCWGFRTLSGLLTPAQTSENSPVFDVPARTYRNRQRSTCYMQRGAL